MNSLLPCLLFLASANVLCAQTVADDNRGETGGGGVAPGQTVFKTDFNTGAVAPVSFSAPWSYQNNLLRNTFTATPAQILNPVWLLTLVADDGSVVCLNGVEIARLNRDTVVPTDALAAKGNGLTSTCLPVNLAGLVQPGLNTITVEVGRTTPAGSAPDLEISLVPGLSRESGFSYADGLFEASQPDAVSGMLAESEGQFSSGALKVSVTNINGNSPNSGGWERSLTVPVAGEYRIEVTYRLLVAVTSNLRGTYGEAVLTVNGTRYGSGPGTSLERYTRTTQRTGTSPGRWQTASLLVPLQAGTNTLRLGAYHSDDRAVINTTVWFDDLSVVAETIHEEVNDPDGRPKGMWTWWVPSRGCWLPKNAACAPVRHCEPTHVTRYSNAADCAPPRYYSRNR